PRGRGLSGPAPRPPPASVAGRSSSSGSAIPSSAPAGAAVASAPSLAPTNEADEEAEWAKIAGDTATGALSDTDRSGRSAARRLAEVKEQKRLKGVIGTVGLVLRLGLVVGLVLMFRPRGDVVATRQPLQVTKQGGAGQHKSIQQAMRAAIKGDVIELLDESYEENVQVDPDRGGSPEVTLRAAADKQVKWTSAKKDVPLLRLRNARGFKLDGKGITMDGTLDGGRHLDHLIFVSG